MPGGQGDFGRYQLLQVIRRYRYAVFAFLVLAVLGLLLFSSTGHDDSHITYWSAYTLSHFGRVLNYNGDPVEQSSTLLQVLLLAAIAAIPGTDISAAGVASSLLSGGLCLVLVQKIACELKVSRPYIAPFLLATMPFFVYYSFSGLDATLMAFVSLLLILALYTYLRAGNTDPPLFPGIAIALFLLARPESPVVLAVLLAALAATAGVHALLNPENSRTGFSGSSGRWEPSCSLPAVRRRRSSSSGFLPSVRSSRSRCMPR
jgi:hypothetical protein